MKLIFLKPLTVCILIVAFTFYARSSNSYEEANRITLDKIENLSIQKNSNIYKAYEAVEQMPYFPGGESEMMKFIRENIQYPASAKEYGIQGRVILRFVVTETGTIENITVLRSLDPACDKEAIRLLESMPKWIPGKQNDEIVSVYYTLPIAFSYEEANRITLDKKETYSIQKNSNIYKAYEAVEQMPYFPGGESEMMKFIRENIQYPASAKEYGIQGRVILRFVVTETGTIENITVLRSLDPACDKEAIRLLESMPKWIPGKQNDEIVSVYYTLPIAFKLQTRKSLSKNDTGDTRLSVD